LSARRIAVVVIGTTNWLHWPRIKRGVAVVVDAINGAKHGNYVEVFVP